MDRSYLSDQAVVSASRAFICVRLVTYEDADEMEFMKSTYLFRTPTKNSLFAILDPTAREHLVAPGRSMKNTFKDAAEMARHLGEISQEYPRAKRGKRPLCGNAPGAPTTLLAGIRQLNSTLQLSVAHIMGPVQSSFITTPEASWGTMAMTIPSFVVFPSNTAWTQ